LTEKVQKYGKVTGYFTLSAPSEDAESIEKLTPISRSCQKILLHNFSHYQGWSSTSTKLHPKFWLMMMMMMMMKYPKSKIDDF
jgi:hypothetical protein